VEEEEEEEEEEEAAAVCPFLSRLLLRLHLSPSRSLSLDLARSLRAPPLGGDDEETAELGCEDAVMQMACCGSLTCEEAAGGLEGATPDGCIGSGKAGG
jgi:hypothetical protein